MTDFMPGLELNRLFYSEAVKPILDREFPAQQYSAALIGVGSEVLGFDTEMSSDHHWGPRVMLFFPDEEDYPRKAIDEALRAEICDPILMELSGKRCIGSIDHFSDSVDLRCSATLRKELRALYGENLPYAHP